jgi:hypothetical protein
MADWTYPAAPGAFCPSQPSPSFHDVEVDRQILTEEQAASSGLLTGVVKSVGREAAVPLGGRWYPYLEVETPHLIRLGLLALGCHEQSRRDGQVLALDPDS